MIFIHTADLHLGKTFNDISLLPDQEFILDRIAEAAADELADAVVIAGDVYQRSSPQAEAMELFDSFVTKLVNAGLKVFAISGNHDSSLRISYYSSLIKNSGVYVTEKFDGTLQSVTLKDGCGEIVFWLMPYIRPGSVRRFYPDKKIVTYEDAVRCVVESADVDKSKRNVLICHQFVDGGVESGSEELQIGGLDRIDPSLFDAFDYVAMGHIHGPQYVCREEVRYSGSPLKYSFSETGHDKSVTVVNMEEKGITKIKTVPLYPLRDVRTVEGMYEEVMNMPYSEDYVRVILHDEHPSPDAKLDVSTVFPNMLKFTVENSRTKYDVDVLATGSMEEKSVTELFRDFYMLQNNGVEPDPEQTDILEKVLKQIGEEQK